MKAKLNPTQDRLPPRTRERSVARLNQTLADRFTEDLRELGKALWFIEASA